MSKARDNLSTVAFCLVFALAFGSVGVFASYAIGTALWEGFAAREWVRVKADVLEYGGGAIKYRYRVDDRDYVGDRLGPGIIQPSDIDEATDARIAGARVENRPITVFVDPADPARAMLDPAIRWQMMLFLSPFALAFGGVGVGAVAVMVKVLASPGPGQEKPGAKVASASSHVWGIWLFAFFWNALAIPISLLAVPELIRDGEWLGLLILLFPLIGLFVLWAAVKGTWVLVRRGSATMHVHTSEPRMGGVVAGHITGSRLVPGDTFRVKISAVTGHEKGMPVTHWTKEETARAVQGPQGTRVAFSFGTPDRPPAGAALLGEDLHWNIALHRPGEASADHVFALQLLPPIGYDEDADEDDEEDKASGMVGDDDEQPVPAGIPKGLEGIAAFIGKERVQERIGAMSASQRAQLHARFEGLSPGQKKTLEQVGKYAHHGPLVKKLVIAAVLLVVGIQVVGVLGMFMFAD